MVSSWAPAPHQEDARGPDSKTCSRKESTVLLPLSAPLPPPCTREADLSRLRPCRSGLEVHGQILATWLVKSVLEQGNRLAQTPPPQFSELESTHSAPGQEAGIGDLARASAAEGDPETAEDTVGDHVS